MEISIYCDGGARGNPGPAAAGFLIQDSAGKTLVSRGIYLGKTTNNQAEYLAVVNALLWVSLHQTKLFSSPAARHQPPATITCFLDSQLIVNQLSGSYKIKSFPLKSLAHQVKTLAAELTVKINFYYLPRQKNRAADKLVNQILDLFTPHSHFISSPLFI